MTIGEKILKLRKEKNLNQEELAERVNVTRQTISNWETDNTVPDFYQTIELCKVLKIDINEFAKEWINAESNEVLDGKDKIYKEVLDEIKENVSNLSFETWFKDTNLIKLGKNEVIIKTKLPIQRRHLQINYKEILKDTINKVANKNYKDIVIIDDIKE